MHALHKIRTFTGWYTHGIPGGRELRRRISDLRTVDEFLSAVESVFEILGSRRLNHHVVCEGGLLAEESARRLREFFQKRRQA